MHAGWLCIVTVSTTLAPTAVACAVPGRCRAAAAAAMPGAVFVECAPAPPRVVLRRPQHVPSAEHHGLVAARRRTAKRRDYLLWLQTVPSHKQRHGLPDLLL